MGGQILKLEFVNGDDLRVETTTGIWLWSPEGDCCARASVDNDGIVLEEMRSMVGQNIVRAELGFGDDPNKGDEYAEAHDITFYKIIGSEKDISFTLHVRHNGYYGGRLECKEFHEKSPIELLADTQRYVD
jgi:hypothetical protein